MKKLNVYFVLTLFFLVLHLYLLVNLRFTVWPEMLSYPYLRNNGYWLYRDMIHTYPPLLTMILSVLYKIFGYKLEVIKIFTWTIIVANDILILLIVKKLTKKKIATLTGLAFYVLLQPFLEGNQLWFDLAITTPILAGLYFLIKDKYGKLDLFAIGFLFAVAAAIKQTAGVFIVATLIWFLIKRIKFKKLFYYLLGIATVGLPLLIRLMQEDVLPWFFNWTLVYPFAYWSRFPGYVQMYLTGYQFTLVSLILLPLPVGLFIVRKKLSKPLMLLIASFILSVILVYPRFSFFHSQLALAVLAIIYAYIYSIAKEKRAFGIILLGLVLLSIALIYKVTIPREWQKEARFWTSTDLTQAQKVRLETKGGTTYLLGPSSALYIYADVLPPKPWVDNFGWLFEVPGVQESVLASWSTNKPSYVVVNDPEPGNWYDLGTYRPKKLMEWINTNYNKKKMLDSGMWLWELKSK